MLRSANNIRHAELAVVETMNGSVDKKRRRGSMHYIDCFGK